MARIHKPFAGTALGLTWLCVAPCCVGDPKHAEMTHVVAKVDAYPDAGVPASRPRFLEVCFDSADCSAGLTCHGETCTKACYGDAACASLLEEATCSPSGSCELICQSDADCDALGEDAVCNKWLGCRMPLLVTRRDDGSIVNCADRATTLAQVVKGLVAAADRACVSDADCERVTIMTSCYDDACRTYAFSRGGAAALHDWLITFEAEQCEPALRAACPRAPDECWGPFLPAPKCIDSTCTQPAPNYTL
jgi:hypothetical protein